MGIRYSHIAVAAIQARDEAAFGRREPVAPATPGRDKRRTARKVKARGRRGA